MKKALSVIGSVILLLVGYFCASFLGGVGSVLFLMLTEGSAAKILVTISSSLFTCLFISLFYGFLQKKGWLNSVLLYGNVLYTMVVCISFTIIFVAAQASLLDPMMSAGYWLAFPFFPLLLVLSLFSGSYGMMIAVGICLIYTMSFVLVLQKKIKILPVSLLAVACGLCCLVTYFQSPHYKYRNQSHGFTYMGGFSSTDLSDYTPYSDSGKLAALDHAPAFTIADKADMPVLDGAEACYPLYSAVAKTLYENIDVIEQEYRNTYYEENGEIVTFYNTAVGFERLLSGDVDLFFGAKPSQSQQELAAEMGVELVYTPIGREAFVFFVQEDNPVDGLSADQIRSIYHGTITNWQEVGGKAEKIIAFQRPERSGSQSMMVYFMGDVSLKEPLTHEMEYAMMGIVEEVAEYQNEAGAIGYSFRYFLEGLNEVDGVKMLSVDGVYPSTETIKSGKYPLLTTLYCITVKDNDNENVQKVLDFLLSEDGQTLVERSGYSPLQ